MLTPVLPARFAPNSRTLCAGPALAILLSCVSCADPQPFVGTEAFPPHVAVKSRFLHQRGAALVGPDGRPRVLRAVNLGGWLHWEGWIFGAKLDLFDLAKGSEGHLLARLTELYGADTTARFQRAVFERFVAKADFRAIAARGFDAVRLPLHHAMLETDAGWARVRGVVRDLGAAGLGVILDMHAAPGGQSRLFTADPSERLLWDDPAAQNRLVALWSKLAHTFKDDPVVLGYDLLNEPDPPHPLALVALYERLISAVREHDREHLIFLEGSAFSRDFNLFTRRLDDNMAYSPHVYLWLGWPDQTWLDRLQRLSRLHDTPVWIGEFGEDRLADVEGLRRGFEALSGWAIWTWKKVDQGGPPGVLHITAPERWRTLMASLSDERGTKAVLSQAEALSALDAFLAAAARAKPVPGMTQALGR